MVKHFVSHFSLEMKTMQLIMPKRNVSQRTGKCTDFEFWWKIEPSVCHYFWKKKCFLTRLLLVRTLTHERRWGGNDWLLSQMCLYVWCDVMSSSLLKNTLRWDLPVKTVLIRAGELQGLWLTWLAFRYFLICIWRVPHSFQLPGRPRELTQTCS